MRNKMELVMNEGKEWDDFQGNLDFTGFDKQDIRLQR